MNSHLPHLRIVVTVSFFVMIGFALVSGYVLLMSDDEVTKGNIIATWQNFALLAVGFWIGSSSGGKTRTEAAPEPQEPAKPSEPGEA